MLYKEILKIIYIISKKFRYIILLNRCMDSKEMKLLVIR